MGANYAVVVSVVPERHGVLVAYRDGSFNLPGSGRFVRVLAQRAHPDGGASVVLPQPGELGLVLELDPVNSIWLGSIHQQGRNQVEGDPFLESHRHESGVLTQIRRNGDTQFDHPSGLCVRVVEVGGDPEVPGAALPKPRGPLPSEETVAPAPWVVLDHPTAGTLTVDPEGGLVLDHLGCGKLSFSKDGAIALDHVSGAKIGISKDGDLSLSGFKSTRIGGDRRFVMEDVVEWLRTHTHPGVTAGAGVSGPPQAPPPASALSPASFTGPSA